MVVDVHMFVDADGILPFIITGYESVQIYRGVFPDRLSQDDRAAD